MEHPKSKYKNKESKCKDLEPKQEKSKRKTYFERKAIFGIPIVVTEFTLV
jgi:hypothetical protein